MRVAVVGALAAGLITGGCDAGTDPFDDDLRPIEVRVHALGGGAIEGLTATWTPTGAEAVDSVRIGTDGRVTLPRSSAGPGDLRIDGPEPRDFHPILLPIDPARGWYRDLLLVPTRWTIRKGAFAGQTVEMQLDRVVDDRVSAMRYTYLFGRPQPFDEPDRYAIDVRAWPGSLLPAHVAIDHANSTLTTSAADSAAIWEVLDRVEEIVGIDLFRPAIGDWGAGVDENRVVEEGVIRLLRLPGRWRGAHWIGETRAQVSDLGGWAAGERFDRYEDRRSRIDSGTLLIAELDSLRLADGVHPWQTIAVHEVLHVLGLGHTCRLPSPMGPCDRTDEPSAHDVAWMELARELVELEAFESVTLRGLVPSIIGERRIVLGLSALPDFARFP